MSVPRPRAAVSLICAVPKAAGPPGAAPDGHRRARAGSSGAAR
ncbi:hypothetical protein [Streptomyces fuscichromogenes]|nr:hypothetical protein [Streptomyces fuscichromogenes]